GELERGFLLPDIRPQFTRSHTVQGDRHSKQHPVHTSRSKKGRNRKRSGSLSSLVGDELVFGKSSKFSFYRNLKPQFTNNSIKKNQSGFDNPAFSYNSPRRHSDTGGKTIPILRINSDPADSTLIIDEEFGTKRRNSSSSNGSCGCEVFSDVEL
ncbi:unnamed protein product, partial [Meganyctiphanes norvegica]